MLIKCLNTVLYRVFQGWLSMDNKEIDILKVDIIKLIDDNCTCEYNRSTLISKLNLEKLWIKF